MKNGPTPALFCLLLVFSNNNKILTTKQCEKCPSSIGRQDSNTRPFEHELSPITTRPGLRSLKGRSFSFKYWLKIIVSFFHSSLLALVHPADKKCQKLFDLVTKVGIIQCSKSSPKDFFAIVWRTLLPLTDQGILAKLEA